MNQQIATYYQLNVPQQQWVEDKISSMTLEEKIGQLFFITPTSERSEDIATIISEFHIGGVMFRPLPKQTFVNSITELSEYVEIPLFFSANLESGSTGLFTDGDSFHSQMGVAATTQEIQAYRLGKISLREPSQLGLNLTFSPVVDLNINFRNPITNIRTFGSSTQTVTRFAKAYMRAAFEENVGVCLKHFPGDGIDERDQHLLVSVNDLDTAKWMNSFGKIYKELIEEKPASIMMGHIALPNVVADVSPMSTEEEKYLPGTFSKIINQHLLRDSLGFHGLVCTDATLMAGFSSHYPRKDAIPLTVASGCDMVLFTRNLKEDYHFLLDGYCRGIVTNARLQEALERILSLKIHLQLCGPQPHVAKNALSSQVLPIHSWQDDVADQSITLVKDHAGLLPLAPKKYPRIYINYLERSRTHTKIKNQLTQILRDKGFIVTVRDRSVKYNMEDIMDGEIDQEVLRPLFEELTTPVEHFKEKYDLVLLVANFPTQSNQVVNRLQFDSLGNDLPWYITEIPTILISLANPYHLFDVPMIQTAINTYAANIHILHKLVEKLCGESTFLGVSPMDPFCNNPQLRIKI